MNFSPTTFNRTRADILAEMIRKQKVIVPTSAPPAYPQEQVNPYFLRVLRSGNTGVEQVANAVALAEKLEDDEALRRLAADQYIEVEEIRDMIADAADQLREQPYPDREGADNE